MVNQRLRDTSHLYPWDKPVPGGTCLEVGIFRLLRGEVASASKEHAIALLLDLQTLYDRIDHAILEEMIIKAGFPAAGYLVAENQMSQGILPKTDILAGCPFATMMARVYLGPILTEADKLPGLTNVDTCVDDVGADFGGRQPSLVAELSSKAVTCS